MGKSSLSAIIIRDCAADDKGILLHEHEKNYRKRLKKMKNRKPTLIIMAAGMGSRFGGLKQLTPVGPAGELIIDYSIHDALEAGFGKIVFVIKHAIEEEFKEHIGNRIAAIAPVEYVFQELDRLPAGFTVPEGREKPWGTGHAILCCAGVVDGAFAVINADDYYGREGFRLLAEFLKKPQDGEKKHLAMAGYLLKNTLTENGYVSRGVCETDENGFLVSLTERTHIELVNGVPMFTEDDGKTYTPLADDTVVSMNCWAFPDGSLAVFGKLFEEFLRAHGTEMKSEFFLPSVVNYMLETGMADATVLTTPDKWYGMTYSADLPAVKAALADMTKRGIYPEKLWK
jgi:hypothetical protein